jgi:3D (Asp-Asp-Asp) domain-containing protein
VLAMLRALVGWTGLLSSAMLALGLAADSAARIAAAGSELALATPETGTANVQATGGEAVVFDSEALEEGGELAPPPDAAVPGHVASPERGPVPLQKPRASTLHRVYRVTAYSDRGITASGRPVGWGQCAAPANIPFGAKVFIPALGRTFVVTDRTHPRFRHNTVDIFLGSDPVCHRFGCRYLECEITLPGPTLRS